MKKKTKKKVNKTLTACCIYMAIALVVVFLFSAAMIDNDNGRYQYLRHIDYNVSLNDDGSANIVETWNIFVKNTNTLFKSFERSYKYGEITNVSVKDLKNNITLEDYGEWVYHAPKNYFYADREYASSDFEIGWGVAMDRESGWRKYQISYTVTDAMTKYNDCEEFYWQFLAKGKNTVPAEKVTGTIILPKEVSDIEKLRVWAHGEVNGNIERVDNRTVKFKIDKLSPRAMVEVRIVTEDEVASNVSDTKTMKYRYLTKIITEEQDWSEETNSKILVSRYIIGILLAIEAAIIGITYIKISKVNKIGNEKNVEIHSLEYFRDIPRDGDSTPAEAIYLYKFHKTRLNAGDVQQKVVAAIILDLCLKKKISLRTAENKDIMVKITDKPEGLNDDEKEIYKLLEKAGGKEEFNIKELTKYAKKQYYQYSNAITSLVNACRNSLYKLKLIDKAKERKYQSLDWIAAKTFMVKHGYIIFCIIHLLAMFVPYFRKHIAVGSGFGIFSNMTYILIALLPLVLIKIYFWTRKREVYSNISVLTQEGSDEKEQWKALKKYMEDYSLLNEKEVPDLTVWEKYLVYATAFGIADKVIENLKATYPEVFVKESWDNEKMSSYPIIDFACNPYFIHSSTESISKISSIDSTVSKAYSTSITEISRHSSSGGGGRRRWILRRRRPAEEAGGRNGRKIE